MPNALLVIDVQRGLFDPAPRPFEADAVVQRINGLIAKARHGGAPIVFIQHEQPDSPLVQGTEPWQLERGLLAQPEDTFVRKTTPDSFLRTDLQARLDARGVTRVVICGYATEFCVDTTTRRAAALGYPVLLAADAHTTHDKPHMGAEGIRAHHNATLPDISSFGPVIAALPSRDIFFDD